jgi:hypothetical protein
MSEWRWYRRRGEVEARPYVKGEDIGRVWLVSVSDADQKAGSPKAGDMIARNPRNEHDQWLIAAAYFAEHYERQHDAACGSWDGRGCSCWAETQLYQRSQSEQEER